MSESESLEEQIKKLKERKEITKSWIRGQKYVRRNWIKEVHERAMREQEMENQENEREETEKETKTSQV